MAISALELLTGVIVRISTVLDAQLTDALAGVNNTEEDTMRLGAPKTISWKITSKIDPRWNGSGECGGLISISPGPANDHLKKCRKKYGKQPKDLLYGAKSV